MPRTSPAAVRASVLRKFGACSAGCETGRPVGRWRPASALVGDGYMRMVSRKPVTLRRRTPRGGGPSLADRATVVRVSLSAAWAADQEAESRVPVRVETAPALAQVMVAHHSAGLGSSSDGDVHEPIGTLGCATRGRLSAVCSGRRSVGGTQSGGDASDWQCLLLCHLQPECPSFCRKRAPGAFYGLWGTFPRPLAFCGRFRRFRCFAGRAFSGLARARPVP